MTTTLFRLTLEYDGTAFHGWQRQPDLRTVEGELRTAIARVTGERPDLTAAGRTDAGAHAHGQVVGLELWREWAPARLRNGLNGVLPEDVVVSAADLAPVGFHARHHALRRTYRYVVQPRDRRSPISRRYAWQVRGPLGVPAMRRAADTLRGTHDFGAFGRAPRAHGSTVRTVFDIGVRRAASLACDQEGAIIIDVSADAFLYGMMRSIAGTLVAVGQGRLSVEDVADAVGRSSSRRVGAQVAPAHGLHQWRVTYPDPHHPGEVASITSETP